MTGSAGSHSYRCVGVKIYNLTEVWAVTSGERGKEYTVLICPSVSGMGKH